jgi:glycine betaine/proline transport system substrate-binding protein
VRRRSNVEDKEDRMSNQRGRRIGLVPLAVAAVAALVAVAVASTGSARPAACGTVALNENSWVGSTANVYVVKNVLEKRLKCSVKVTNITEGQPAFQAMADGKIDAVLEDWDNTLVTSNKKYLTSKSMVMVGSNGIAGIIGWYIPRYLLKQYPQFKTWKGLKGNESVFKTAESSPNAGTFLGGDPSYVQKDRALIKELGLDLKHVVSGAEPAQVARWTTLYKQHKPVLFYWYDPQYLNAIYDLYRIQLPKRFKGCIDDEKVKGNHACEYAGYPTLDKIVSSKFAKSGSPALKVIKKFSWTSADQNYVSNLISGKHMDKDKAAALWVAKNKAKVNAWLK